MKRGKKNPLKIESLTAAKRLKNLAASKRVATNAVAETQKGYHNDRS